LEGDRDRKEVPSTKSAFGEDAKLNMLAATNAEKVQQKSLNSPGHMGKMRIILHTSIRSDLAARIVWNKNAVFCLNVPGFACFVGH